MSAALALNDNDSSSSLATAQANDYAQTLPRPAKPLVYRPVKAQQDKIDDATAVSTTSPQVADDLPPTVVLPKPSVWVHDQFVPLQKWEGVVLRMGEDSFFARLVDLTSQNVDEEAEFPLEEVSASDFDLLEEGAVFYWDIGYLDQTDGQRRRTSSLRFRRLPSWTQTELREVDLRAARLRELFAGE